LQHHLYTTAAVTHKEVKRGTQTALEACQGLRNDVTAIGDNTHSAAVVHQPELARVCRTPLPPRRHLILLVLTSNRHFPNT
jgi:hypothetical protein